MDKHDADDYVNSAARYDFDDLWGVLVDLLDYCFNAWRFMKDGEPCFMDKARSHTACA